VGLENIIFSKHFFVSQTYLSILHITYVDPLFSKYFLEIKDDFKNKDSSMLDLKFTISHMQSKRTGQINFDHQFSEGKKPEHTHSRTQDARMHNKHTHHACFGLTAGQGI
jgi:hypothetical protein